jgi:uncharacterized protein YjbI with pentapeptide repeats
MTIDTNPSVFLGKYAFVLPDGQNLITLSDTGSVINIEAGNKNSPSDNQMFNLYGDLSTGFIMQAPTTDWNYIDYDSGYVANKDRTTTGLSNFTFQIIDAFSLNIIENVGGVDYYLNANGTTLERVKKTSSPLPDTAVFMQLITTYGLQSMKTRHSSLGAPLTGVYLAQEDLSSVSFMGSDLSNANFSGANLTGQNLNGSTASNTIFDSSNLSKCVANGLVFTNCSFVKANMSYVKLSSSTLNGCNLNLAQFYSDQTAGTDYSNLQNADFTNASMVGCDFGNALVNSAIFKGATLTNADFSQSRGADDKLDFTDAILIGANLSKIDLTKCIISENTNFMGAKLDECDLSSHNLTNVVFVNASMVKTKLDKTNLNGAQMSSADLSFASFTGGVSLIGANLSNSILQAAQFPGAQLGAKNAVTSLPLSDASQLDNEVLPNALTQPPLSLNSSATVSVVQPGNQWTITDANNIYSVAKQSNNLLVKLITATSNSAILSNAYMPNANFEQANLYAVEMSGVQWYGGSASAKSADLGLANLSNSNLSSMKFDQAKMQGASFDFAKLIGTQFIGTLLNPSDNLKPTSFSFSSMQSTTFTSTNLFSANLTNAAFALTDGVPLMRTLKGFVEDLNKGTISASLQKVFSDSGYPLISAATITVNTKDKFWTIVNKDATDNSQTGYSSFNLNYETSLNELDYIQISGASPLLILQVNAFGQQSQLELAFGPTALDPNQMNDDTTCPSGMKLKILGNYLTFTDLMTAALPPTPPKCANCW